MKADSLNVLIMGGTGFIGRELGKRLTKAGHHVIILTRNPEAHRDRMPFPCILHRWRGGRTELPAEALESCDAVVNLVGEGIADKPWTAKQKVAILKSRTQSVQALARAVAGARVKPKVIVQAAAIGYYGDRGDELLHEESAAGSGFLAETSKSWEDAARLYDSLGTRVVCLRIGLVLSLSGGALPKLLGIYAKGLGAVLGTGKQWMSWIHSDDLVNMFTAAIVDHRWKGTFNATAPEPCRNLEFNTCLGAIGRYPAAKQVPELMIQLTMGARKALVLGSVRALPKAAERLGVSFLYRTITQAFEALLGDSVGPKLRRYVTEQWLPVAPAALWPYFTDARNLEALTPPWLSFRVNDVSAAVIGTGTRIRYSLRLHGVPISWESVISKWVPGQSFVDEQERGPFAVWHHTHHFEALQGGTLMTDSLQYRLPAAPLGELVAGYFVERDVARIFSWRSKAIVSFGKGASKADISD